MIADTHDHSLRTHHTKETAMTPLLALHITLLSLLSTTTAAAHNRLGRLRSQDREAGMTTLELTILGLGLFLIAGIAVAVITAAVQGRLDRIV